MAVVLSIILQIWVVVAEQVLSVVQDQVQIVHHGVGMAEMV